MFAPPKGFKHRISISNAKQGKIYRLLTENIHGSPLGLLSCVDSSDDWIRGQLYQVVPDVPCMIVRPYQSPHFYAVVLVGENMIRIGGDYSVQSTGVREWLETYDIDQ